MDHPVSNNVLLSRYGNLVQGSPVNAGSDLASLRTTARQVGDRYLINGQKITDVGTMLTDVFFWRGRRF